MGQPDDQDIREELLELLRMSAETVALLRPSLTMGDEPAPSEERILACLQQLEREGRVRSFLQNVPEDEAFRFDSIPEVKQGARTIQWWELRR